MERKYYVYVLTTEKNTVLYIGVTDNLARRVSEHKSGVIEGFTAKYKVHKLIYAEIFNDINCAIAREKQLKGWTRAKKEALINILNPLKEEILPF